MDVINFDDAAEILIQCKKGFTLIKQNAKLNLTLVWGKVVVVR